MHVHSEARPRRVLTSGKLGPEKLEAGPFEGLLLRGVYQG